MQIVKTLNRKYKQLQQIDVQIIELSKFATNLVNEEMIINFSAEKLTNNQKKEEDEDFDPRNLRISIGDHMFDAVPMYFSGGGFMNRMQNTEQQQIKQNTDKYKFKITNKTSLIVLNLILHDLNSEKQKLEKDIWSLIKNAKTPNEK